MLGLSSTSRHAEFIMRSLFFRVTKPARRRGVRRREVFSARFDGGQSGAMHGTSVHLGCDVLERRIVLTASESDFVFSRGAITGYKGLGGVVDIPSTINGKPVVVIGDNAFKDNITITSVVIPRSVTTIGSFAFQGDAALASVSIGNRVASIGVNAFAYAGLKSLEIPGSVKGIGQGAFRDNFALASVTIGKGVQTIGFEAFRSNTALGSVMIPNTVKTIGGYAFQGDTALKSVSIGRGVQAIGDHAFQGTALKIVSLPKSLKTIGDGAFQDNSALTSVSIPNGVTTIGDSAFAYNGSLTRVSIPGSVKTIGISAFALNMALTNLVIGNGVRAIGDGAFAVNTSLKHVTIPGSVKTIGYGVFGSCTALESLWIGEGVQTIGESAFAENTALTHVTIPNSVRTIDRDAFRDDASLKTVKMGSHLISIGENAFENCYDLKSVTFTAKAPAVGTNAFNGVPFGAKAIRAAGLEGYGPNGSPWNSLIVCSPGRGAMPTVTVNTTSLAQNINTFMITGSGFLSGVPSANTVTFNLGAEGEVTAATPTTLTVTFTKQPTSIGPLTAVVTHVGGGSGVSKQVATVVAADNAEVPFPGLPNGAGSIDPDAPKSFAITPSGLQYRVLRRGIGAKPNANASVTLNYQGWLDGGDVFDSSYPNSEGVVFQLTGVIAGFAEGVQHVGKGGMIEMVIPSYLGYGALGTPGGPIPPDATLHFLVELIDVRNS